MSTFNKGPVDFQFVEAASEGTDTMMWRRRTIAIRKLLGDNIHSVIDVGAGSMSLGRLLNPEVRYYPVDYERHCDETLVCDLNAYQFPDIKADAAVLAGILEYLNDVDWLFDTLAERVSVIVLSYKASEGYSSDELITKLRHRGFILTGWDKEFKEWPLLARFQKAQPQMLAANYFCTGCGACVNSCKAGAIELRPDFQGFLKPQIDAAKCIGCNRCVEVCPSAYLHENDHFTEPDCYAAWAQDDIRRDSSSGGVFTVLAQSILSKGGVVFGAAWTKDFYLEHIGIRDTEELPKLRHSKYVQSNTKDTFRQVKEILECGNPVLYVGTPCQIAGLRSFLGKQYDNLYMIDLICFCSGPAKAFRKYLSEQYGLENVQQVVFRDKQRGWTHGASIHKRDGSVLWLDSGTDDYQKAYHNVLLRNKTCDSCIYAGFPRQGDITLGDFWGIEQHDPSWNDGKGTNLLYVNSEKGQRLLDTVSENFQRIERVPLQWSRGKGNRIGKDGRPRHVKAEEFLTNLNKHSFKESLHMALTDRHDIGLVCMHNDNYGNNLTNYALYQYLNDCGYTVAMIAQAKDAPWLPQEKKFTLFGHIPYKPYDIVPNPENKIEMKQINEKCDTFLVGSDQLFRPAFSEGLGLHPYLDWVASNKYKVSYGTSFGTESFDSDEEFKSKAKYYLKRFQAISVREASGVDILNKELGIDGCVYVLDPVFLCGRKRYEEMARFGTMRLPRKAFLGGYILDPSDRKSAVIDMILKQCQLSDISILSDGDAEADGRDTSILWNKPILRHSLVEEWLANILYSDVFITDSFHGACFALIFEKDFWIVTNEASWRGGERLRNLVSMLGIENRLILERDDLCAINFGEHINYAVVNSKLEQQREESRNWLISALNRAKVFVGSYNDYDILGERIDNVIVSLQKTEARLVDDERKLEELDKTHTAESADRQQLKALMEYEVRRMQEAGRKVEQLLRDKKELEIQIATMYRSNSWKITYPLRKIRAVCRGFIEKITSLFRK